MRYSNSVWLKSFTCKTVGLPKDFIMKLGKIENVFFVGHNTTPFSSR